MTADALPAEITDICIVVVTERDGSGEGLIRELQRTRNRIRHIWPMPETLPTDADVIFCDLVSGLPARLPWLPGEPKAALVALISPGWRTDLDLLRKAAPEAVLHRPFSPAAILSSLILARSRFTYERRLRDRLEKLDATLRSMRNIERAKAILMKARNIDEDEAYGWLRAQAMRQRLPVSAVATKIVDIGETAS